MWYTSSSGRIEIEMTLVQARSMSHQGQCDEDVKAASEIPAIKRQLDKIDPAVLRSELRGFGTWNDDELADHDQNIQRILWIAAGDIVEEYESPKNRR